MAIITQTPRIIIREFLPEEQELFFYLMNDTRINEYLPKRDEQQIRDVFIDTIADYLKGIKLTRWGMFDSLTGDFIGLALLKYVAEEPHWAELGYVLHLNYHGKGIATEMAKALLSYGFEQMGLAEIFAVTNHVNIPSQQVLLKAGLKQGKHITRGGEELSFFNITNQDYRS
ncbi:GNAT family N-acetyltransferase [Mucilaginibacter sp. HMF5004]|uniref:GNAT family N-acetyltransferase n=1 Tax=Mucilaginibacter rivuli TaxID=2857527 RepID=UPI001C5E2E48|nr:GNAT family N-acetyltransferase [Mucilaginibacter rivuli]MBW4888209.1 GNAT family N-acetyltransferase [Mucilaginibacter rivuli]